jgi:hypothetical protein
VARKGHYPAGAIEERAGGRDGVFLLVFLSDSDLTNSPSSHLRLHSFQLLWRPISITRCCTCGECQFRCPMFELFYPFGGHAYLMRTWPSVPVCLRSMYSSVSDNCMFMYESTLIKRPLYSVWPHLSRIITSSLILYKQH